MKKKKLLVFLTLVLVFLAFLVACSARDQVRWSGTKDLGDLPADMLYVDGVPQIITISTESDGDVVVAYRSTDGGIYAQLYGCAVISLNCGQLYEQGRYKWSIPDQTEDK